MSEIQPRDKGASTRASTKASRGSTSAYFFGFFPKRARAGSALFGAAAFRADCVAAMLGY
jgi:hypothetical protein